MRENPWTTHGWARTHRENSDKWTCLSKVDGTFSVRSAYTIEKATTLKITINICFLGVLRLFLMHKSSPKGFWLEKYLRDLI